ALNPYEGDRRSGRNEFWQYNLSMSLEGSSPVVQNGFVYMGACSYEQGALFSFVCNTDMGNTDIGPAKDAPWAQARNKSANTGKTDYTPDTIAPAVASTDPAPGIEDMEVGRDSISVTFTMPMEPSSIYEPPDPENEFEGYSGFTVEPFDAEDEDFDVSWNDAKTRFTLTLPEGAAFERDTEYTATILSKASAASDSNGSILYTYNWSFSNTRGDEPSNSHDAWSCFIGALGY
ncbi:MAG: Ig-like domain-containing protein, partial [Desulfosalsimonadaceae bacterium]